MLNDYTVRESARAKHARLTVSPRQGLVVVIPIGYDRRRIPTLIREKKPWLERCARRIESQRGAFEPEPSGGLPERLQLRSIGEEWSIDYHPTDSNRVALSERADSGLLIRGNAAKAADCHAVLARWLRRKAHAQLAPWLIEIADERGFRVTHVSVRSQRTRWGSCSKKARVSLNVKLLFLPEDLTRYVLLHELCHTVHLNHSKDFWRLVRDREPDVKDKETSLRAAWRYVPAWLDA